MSPTVVVGYCSGVDTPGASPSKIPSPTVVMGYCDVDTPGAPPKSGPTGAHRAITTMPNGTGAAPKRAHVYLRELETPQGGLPSEHVPNAPGSGVAQSQSTIPKAPIPAIPEHKVINVTAPEKFKGVYVYSGKMDRYPFFRRESGDGATQPVLSCTQQPVEYELDDGTVEVSEDEVDTFWMLGYNGQAPEFCTTESDDVDRPPTNNWAPDDVNYGPQLECNW